MNLEEAIAQLIELGEKDPLEIARKLSRQQGDVWLGEQLVAYAESLVAEIARQRLGSMRRSAQVALRPGDTIDSSELKLRSFWVPEIGYKRANDLTPDDLLARAAWNETLALAIWGQARWCRDVAALMVSEGAKVLGRLKAPLPALGDGSAGELT